jgi:hypothetical protein
MDQKSVVIAGAAALIAALLRIVADGPGFTRRNRFAPPLPPSTGTRAGGPASDRPQRGALYRVSQYG